MGGKQNIETKEKEKEKFEKKAEEKNEKEEQKKKGENMIQCDYCLYYRISNLIELFDITICNF